MQGVDWRARPAKWTPVYVLAILLLTGGIADALAEPAAVIRVAREPVFTARAVREPVRVALLPVEAPVRLAQAQEPGPTAPVVLQVERDGNGGVVSNPQGINCGLSCTATFAPGTQVTLRARPDSGWQVTSWNGCDAVSDRLACSVTVKTSQVIVGVKFTSTFRLTVNPDVPVIVTPPGRECSSSCDLSYPRATTVTIRAARAIGVDWSGCDKLENSACTVTVNRTRVVGVQQPGWARQLDRLFAEVPPGFLIGGLGVVLVVVVIARRSRANRLRERIRSTVNQGFDERNLTTLETRLRDELSESLARETSARDAEAAAWRAAAGDLKQAMAELRRTVGDLRRLIGERTDLAPLDQLALTGADGRVAGDDGALSTADDRRSVLALLTDRIVALDAILGRALTKLESQEHNVRALAREVKEVQEAIARGQAARASDGSLAGSADRVGAPRIFGAADPEDAWSRITTWLTLHPTRGRPGAPASIADRYAESLRGATGFAALPGELELKVEVVHLELHDIDGFTVHRVTVPPGGSEPLVCPLCRSLTGTTLYQHFAAVVLPGREDLLLFLPPGTSVSPETFALGYLLLLAEAPPSAAIVDEVERAALLRRQGSQSATAVFGVRERMRLRLSPSR